jgi:hypothetical protein
MTFTITREDIGVSTWPCTNIVMKAFNSTEAIGAGRDMFANNNLLLTYWRTGLRRVFEAATDNSEPIADGTIAIAIMADISTNNPDDPVARRVVTAVRATDGRLKLISWSISPVRRSVRRIADSGNLAGAVSVIAMTRIRESDLLVTAVRAGNGRLKLISWRLRPNGTFLRLGDSGDQGEEVSLICATAFGNELGDTIVTAVKTAAGILKLIAWQVSDDGSSIQRRSEGTLSSRVRELSMDHSVGLVQGFESGVVTAAITEAGSLNVVTWRIPTDGSSIQRLNRSTSPVSSGARIGIARITSPVSATGVVPTFVTSINQVDTGEHQKLIAFEIGPNGSVTEAGSTIDQEGFVRASESAMARSGTDVITARVESAEAFPLVILTTWQTSSDVSPNQG